MKPKTPNYFIQNPITLNKRITVTLLLLLSFYAFSNFTYSVLNNFQIPLQNTSAEEDSIQKYISDHKLIAQKTSSGLYYVVENEGDGEKIISGKKVTVNYTGGFLNGKIFDSSTNPDFGHVEPIQFVIGQGMVIKGWEEGITLFNVGGKGKLIIPSSLAYGTNGAGETIAPNTPLVFEIEILKMQHAKKKNHSGKNSKNQKC